MNKTNGIIDYSKVPTGALRFRRAFGLQIMHWLTHEWKDEPEAQQRYQEYKAKVKAYNRELKRRKVKRADKPEAVTIKAKAGDMGAKYG